MAKKDVFSEEELKEINGLATKIRRAQSALLEGRVSPFKVGLNYLTPPTSGKIKTALKTIFRGKLKLIFSSTGIELEIPNKKNVNGKRPFAKIEKIVTKNVFKKEPDPAIRAHC